MDNHHFQAVVLAVVCMGKKHNLTKKTPNITPWFATKSLEHSDTISKMKFQGQSIFSFDYLDYFN